MRDLGAFFAADDVAAPDQVAETTGRVGAPRTASQRSSPGLFEREVVARPCRWPCDNAEHVHAEDLPANRIARANHPLHEQPYLRSDLSEVRDQ